MSHLSGWRSCRGHVRGLFGCRCPNLRHPPWTLPGWSGWCWRCWTRGGRRGCCARLPCLRWLPGWGGWFGCGPLGWFGRLGFVILRGRSPRCRWPFGGMGGWWPLRLGLSIGVGGGGWPCFRCWS